MIPIAAGAVGPEVEDVQRRLDALGHTCLPDELGTFGAGTDTAVRAFQQRRGLIADGIVGEDTWRSLVEAGLHLGDRLLYLASPFLRGDDVRELQRRLNQLGFDTGRVDGWFGPDTEAGLCDFQLNMALRVDGKAGLESVGLLRRLHRTHQAAAAASVRERELLRTVRRVGMAGARILVDAAHGPDDPGGTNPDGVPEHEVTWQLASRLAGRLQALGATVVLSRGPATTPSPADRALLANREEVEAIVSLHTNTLASADAAGVAAYYFGHEGYASERGRWLAQLALDRLVDATGAPDCRTHASTSALLRASRAPAALVEPGFLTHPDEGRQLAENSYQARIAEALTDALGVWLAGSVTPAPADPSTV